MSLAKNFEKLFREQVNTLDNIYCLRLYDTVGFAGVFQPADFICFDGKFYLCELKTTQGASLPFRNIADTQFSSMSEAIKRAKGIMSYVIVWFYDKDITRAFTIQYLNRLRKAGKKSVRYDDENGILITGTKKHTYWKWSWQILFKGAKYVSK